MARQWFAEGVQVYEDGTKEIFVEGVQLNEDQGVVGPPAAPTNLVATAVGADVQLTWDKTADGGQVEIWRRRL